VSTRLARRLVICLALAVPVAAQTVLVGSGTSTTASARVMENGGEVNEVLSTPPHTNGVTVAHGDVNGDGFPDIITGAANGSTTVQVFNGATNAQLHFFTAFDPAFTGGVFVATGDVNGDGFDDIVVGAGQGGAPRVRVFHGVTGAVLHDFLAYTAGFTGGVRVAAADHNGDGKADVITAPGPGDNDVNVFNGANAALLTSFEAMPWVAGGLFVAAGDLDVDGYADVVIGSGSGEPQVIVYSGATNNSTTGFYPFALSNTAGVRVGVVMNDQDLNPYIVAGTGPGVQTTVKTFHWPSNDVAATFTPYGTANTGGVHVAGFDTRPTATIVTTGTVCAGQPIVVQLTGRGDSYRVTWSDEVTQTSPSKQLEREAHAPGTYTIAKVEDLNQSSAFTFGSATVTDQGGPVFTTHPQTQTIQSGQTATLTASASGGGSVFYKWYEDRPGRIPLFEGTGATQQVGPLSVTARFYVVAENDACSRMSQIATVHVTPSAPAGLTATATSTVSVFLDWNSMIAASYDIYRSSGSGFTFVANTAFTEHSDTGLTAGKSYLYRVVARSSDGLTSAPSNTDLATTVIFTDATLTAGTTKIKAAHVNQLRTAIDAVRALAGLAPGTYANATLTAGETVNAGDITELRTQLNAARSALSFPTLTFDDATLTAGSTRIKAAHVQQLRSGTQ
jgi:hypothetical protein